MAFPSLTNLPRTTIKLSRLSSRFFTSCCKDPKYPLPQIPPPVAKRIPFNVSAHGKTWEDPYHWMSNTQDPDFIDYLHSENSYAQAFMEDTRLLQEKLVSEMKARLPTKVSTPPERWGPWLYYQYIPEGKEFPVLCRRLENENVGWVKKVLNHARGLRKEEILLDWNAIAEQYGYVHVGTCRVSPDHNFLAYTVDRTGSECFILQIKNLRTGSVLSHTNVECVVSLAWAQDSHTLFYTLFDSNQRPNRVLCTNLRSHGSDDMVIFTENDPRFCVDITNTKDGKFITVNSNSRTSSEEVYLLDAINPHCGLKQVCKRLSDVQFYLEHHYGFFYILTNAPLSESMGWSGQGYYLTRCQVQDIESAKSREVILPGEDTFFQDMDVFNGHLVLSINKKGLLMLCSIDLPITISFKQCQKLENLNPWFFPMPSNLCSILPGSNHDFMSGVYRAVLSSPVMPDVIVDYDMSRRKFSTLYQEEMACASDDPGQHSSAKKCIKPLTSGKDSDKLNLEMLGWKDLSDVFCCERVDVTSEDGVKIPLTLLYSKAAWRKGQSPGLIHGYGAYGEVLDVSWCPERLSLLDRGWVVAFADVRGGGGVDSSWHESGTGFDKHNSINDFALCSHYLVNEGLVHKDQLCAIGYSAGGLLMGAIMNIDPTLFHAVILKVPFLDICNTLLDPSLPLTTLDYEEFGNPQIMSQFEYIMSYSPYNNIAQGGCYPATLVTTSFLDSRVGVWEAAKWVAKVRSSKCSTCSRSVLLRTNMTGGHFSEGGHHQRLEETAYDYAFLLKVIGSVCK